MPIERFPVPEAEEEDRDVRRTPPPIIGFVAALALALGASMPSVANETGELAPIQAPPVAADEGVNELPNTWFVELAGPPVTRGGAAAAVKREQDQFRANARGQGLNYVERFSYGTLFNGLSVTLEDDQLSTLQRLPGVARIWPVVTLELEPIEQISPDLATALAMTGADVAQSELGLTGAGVRVAVMDTGIDYDHPDLGGCFGDGCRVEAGWDFVGDAFNADASSPNYNPVTVPGPDPDDCNGHGTHVAGIVGASGEVTGVAPDVTFGAYRVFGCAGSTTADIMAAAMERAYADGMHVLNMSIGSAFQWPQYPTAVAADNLAAQGVVVVASIGNSGANGTYSTGAPGNGKDVIGVASFDNTHINALTFEVNPSGESVPYLQIVSSTEAPTSGTTPEVVYVGRGCPVEAGATTEADEYLADPAGKVALIDRGTCTFNGKYQRAIDAGAVGVVIANNAAGLFAGGGIVDRGTWAVGISLADGNFIKAELGSGPVTLTWTENRENAPNPTGGLISSFSSYGLAPDLSLKPNIGAPGGLIRSTYPLELGEYAIVSGTSMSAPHVAGAAALYLEANPGASPAEVKTRFQNTAEPKNWWGNPGLGFLDNVHRQGAGMLAIDAAVLTATAVTPSEIAMGEGQAGAKTHTLTVSNTGPGSVTYQLSHVAALATGGSTFTPGFFLSNASAEFSAPSVTVDPGASATVDVTITPASSPNLGQYGGYLVLAGDDGSTLRVPYAGFVGDYQAITAMPIGDVFPTLARLTACDRFVETSCTMGASYALADDGEVYTLEDGLERPHFLIHLDHQVRELRLEVLQERGRNWGRIATFDYFGRNSTATSFFAFAFDGETQAGRAGRNFEVPDGTYRVKVSVLKALGDPGNPDHWETWTSDRFVIDRP